MTPSLKSRLVEASATYEIGGVIRASAAFVPGHERIAAQRSRTGDRPGLIAARGRQCRRRSLLLHPAEQRVQLTVRRRTRASAAVADAGSQEQARELGRLLRAAHLLLNALVVIDGSRGGDERIGPAVPHDRPAAAIAERG